MRKVDATHTVDVDDHHFKLVANADYRFDIGDAVLRKFADVNHPVLAWKYLYESTERHYPHHSAGISITNFNVLGQRVDGVLGLLGVFTIGGSDNDRTVVLDIDGDTELVDHSSND